MKSVFYSMRTSFLSRSETQENFREKYLHNLYRRGNRLLLNAADRLIPDLRQGITPEVQTPTFFAVFEFFQIFSLTFFYGI